MLAKEHPQVVQSANQKIVNFINSESFRTKDVNIHSDVTELTDFQVVPALGEFLPLLLISDKTWKDVQEAYLKENFDRNVQWIIKKFPGIFFG